MRIRASRLFAPVVAAAVLGHATAARGAEVQINPVVIHLTPSPAVCAPPPETCACCPAKVTNLPYRFAVRTAT
jgi:hypothetical protein